MITYSFYNSFFVVPRLTGSHQICIVPHKMKKWDNKSWVHIKLLANWSCWSHLDTKYKDFKLFSFPNTHLSTSLGSTAIDVKIDVTPWILPLVQKNIIYKSELQKFPNPSGLLNKFHNMEEATSSPVIYNLVGTEKF